MPELRIGSYLMLAIGLWLASASAYPTWGQEPDAGHVASLVFDVSEAPHLAPWAEQAKELVRTWQPKIAAILQSDVRPAEIKLVFRRNLKAVAATSGNTISISVGWVEKHPEDLGMVVHELTHVIQGYPRGGAPWLVESIADYVRYVHYEPQAGPTHLDPLRQNYRDGYKTGGLFLGWVEKRHGANVVPELNRALRNGKYDYETFRRLTGKSVDRLWADYIDELVPAAK
ncbi:MAG: DUF4157 domain-containing protein [Planctomycetes bacterium]|nr:DUF4157 domain-containing protein [Planctomycetota bacterium]